MRSQWKCRHGEHVVPAKIMLHISMETWPATQSPVAEVELCSTSAFWSRRRPATPGDRSRGCRWSLHFWYCESALRHYLYLLWHHSILQHKNPGLSTVFVLQEMCEACRFHSRVIVQALRWVVEIATQEM